MDRLSTPCSRASIQCRGSNFLSYAASVFLTWSVTHGLPWAGQFIAGPLHSATTLLSIARVRKMLSLGEQNRTGKRRGKR
jgi:hypothetical protein